jgi:hypothetical protein
MLRRRRHVFTGHVYEELGDGLLRVTDPATGQEGIFNDKAEWQSGELKYADLHLCGAVAGRRGAAIATTEDDHLNQGMEYFGSLLERNRLERESRRHPGAEGVTP